MKYIILGLITIYQKTLSPDHGWGRIFYPYGFCRFYPSCSEYAYRAIEIVGVIRGGFLGFWHLIHCNSFSTPAVIRQKYPRS